MKSFLTKLNEIEEIYVWIAFVLYLFSLGYLGTGGQNMLVFLFVIIFTAIIIWGIWQAFSELLKNYNAKGN